MLRFLERLFMNDYQRALVNPDLYTHEFDAAALEARLRSDRLEPESRGLMLESLKAGTQQGGINLARVVEQIDGYDQARREYNDRTALECIRDGRLGASLLAAQLISQANQLARGILPGAGSTMSDLLG